MHKDVDFHIPKSLVLAQELQKGRDYYNSRNLYNDFFINNQNHYLRFKALFEVADNWFHEKKYANAEISFSEFINYCDKQQNLTEQEKEWIKYYRQLALSRIKEISKVIRK
ncbi:MAG TPA: hypothetical protein VEB00_10695 [Clostridia bacterium]|nr:hypothetical protein [Clostridia bacterium]